jgi:hypothetical protein
MKNRAGIERALIESVVFRNRQFFDKWIDMSNLMSGIWDYFSVDLLPESEII